MLSFRHHIFHNYRIIESVIDFSVIGHGMSDGLLTQLFVGNAIKLFRFRFGSFNPLIIVFVLSVVVVKFNIFIGLTVFIV